MIELTNCCTLRCPTCFFHQDDCTKVTMSFKNFKKVIDDNVRLINSLSLYHYGEPFLNRNLPEMIYYAKKKGVPYIKVATNGMHLSAANIRRVVKS
ncbi:MAG: radical SAM protein [Candidatus Omnitrophica bacterium]|nr:radical SAM protein [Candidatus Omnitrophota bacterium]